MDKFIFDLQLFDETAVVTLNGQNLSTTDSGGLSSILTEPSVTGNASTTTLTATNTSVKFKANAVISVTAEGTYNINGKTLAITGTINQSSPVKLTVNSDGTTFSTMEIVSGQVVHVQNSDTITIGNVVYKNSTTSDNSLVFGANPNTETTPKFALTTSRSQPLSLTAVSSATSVQPVVVTQQLAYNLNGNYTVLSKNTTGALTVTLNKDGKTIDSIALSGDATISQLDLKDGGKLTIGEVTYSGNGARFTLAAPTETDSKSGVSVTSITGNPVGTVTLSGGTKDFTVPGNGRYKIGDSEILFTVSGISDNKGADTAKIGASSTSVTLTGAARVSFAPVTGGTTIDNIKYTGNGTATVTLIAPTETSANSSIKTTEGTVTVAIGSGKSVEIGGALLSATNNAADLTITNGALTAVTADVTVTLDKGESLTFNGTKYRQTGSTQSTMTLPASGVVTLDSNSTIINVGSGSSKNVFVSTSENSTTLEIDASTKFSEVLSADNLGRGTNGKTIKMSDLSSSGYSSSVGNVIPAPNSGAESSDYAVTTYAMDGYTEIAVSATDVQATSSAASGDKSGYWAGFALIPPTGATKIKSITGKATKEAATTALASAQASEEANVALVKYADKNSNVTGWAVFCDLADYKGNAYWYAFQWQDDSGNNVGDVQYYRVDFYDTTKYGDDTYSFAVPEGESLNFAEGYTATASTADAVLKVGNITYTLKTQDTSSVTFGAKNSAKSFGAGEVVAALDTTDGVTVKGVTFKSGDNGNANDTITITDGVVTAFGTGTVIAALDATNGVKVGTITYKSGNSGNASDTITITKGAVTAYGSGTVVATLDNEIGLLIDNVTYKSENNGTITLKNGKYNASSGAITADITKSLDTEAVTVAGAAYTVTSGSNGMTFTLKDGVATAVSGMESDTKVYGDLTEIKTANTSTITIAGDKTVELVGGNNVISAINSVSGGATIAGAAVAGAAITTDSVGSFKFGTTAAISVTGDSSVTFTLGTDTAVSAVTNFDEKGTISGNLNGIAFTSAAAIGDTAKLNITKDTDFAVVNDGSALYLANISNGAVIANAGGMKKVVTDEAGTFSFGSAQKVTVTGDSSVEFTLGDNSTVTAVSSIASATLSVSSDTTSISINGGDAITFSGTSKAPTFVIDGNGKITEVSGASVVSGLTGDVNVIETSSAKIGDDDINITGDTSYAVSVVSGKVGEISSVSANAVVNVKNATVNTDSNGKFTFASDVYNVAGDTAVQFITGENSVVSAINGLEGTIQTTDKEITINGDTVTVATTGDATLTYEGGTAGIAAITGLTDNATVTGAENAALNLVGTTVASVATSLTANGNLFQLLNDSDGVTITGGTEVTDLEANASLIAANAGSYVVNGTTLDVAAGEVIRGTSEGTAEIYSAENVSEVTDTATAESTESLAAALGIDTLTYGDSLSGAALDSVTSAINSSSSADKSALNGNMKFGVSATDTSTSGATQDVDLSGNTGKKDVTLNKGNQSLKFNDEGGNIAEVGKDATGNKDVALGNGGDVAIIAKGTSANVNIVAGKGPDTVVSGAKASVDVRNGGATKVRAVSGAIVTMNNYDASTSKAGVQTTNSNIAEAIGKGNIELTNGAVTTKEGNTKSTVQVNSGSSSADVVTSADAGDTEGSTIVNLYNNAGKMTKVGFTHTEGGTVDLSSQKAETVIQGNASGAKSGESTLLGGSGKDTIFAGSGDVVDAGAGANRISLSSSENAETGATVQMTSATGRNNVEGFSYGFADSNDAISLDMTNAKFTIDDNGNLIVKNGRAKTTLTGASSDGDTSYAQVRIKDAAGDEVTKAAIAKEGNIIEVSADEDTFANSYIGDGSGLSFSKYESEVNLNLAGTTATFGGEEVQVSGINNVTLGEADATVFGSDAKETITAGSGNETIWAGAGKDTLIGFGNSEDKNGSITFGFVAGDGIDVVQNFGYLTTENAQTADRVWTTGQFEATLSGNDVKLTFNGNKKDSLTLEGMKGKNIQLSENGNLENVTTVLQVSDTLLTYDGLATKYIATGSNASVVATSDTATANIWLEDKYSNLSNNTTYTGKIKAVNAAAVEGSATLVGNSYDNLITGAQGSSSMWGGDSTSNDTLIGGTEGNMFFYGVTGGNEGNDTISGITEDDTINLFGIKLSDIDLSNSSWEGSTITLQFNAGGSLTMANNGQTFMIANDQSQRYTYDRENSTWTKA